MGGLLSILGTALLLSVSYVMMKFLRSYFSRSPLDNIPGPPAHSWLRGKQRTE